MRRYQSVIHGNYRRAYLQAGCVVALLLIAQILIRQLLMHECTSPLGYLPDALLLLSLLLLMIRYRKSLDGSKVSMKELMLFGMGTSCIAAVGYGLLLVLHGLCFKDQSLTFASTLMGHEVDVTNTPIHYWTLFVAIITVIETALLGSFGAFVFSILLKTEKPEKKK
ncbi:MAG: hypothetical protein IJ761_00955 [Bacteroidales bacterium]|nr:hypothetical protein [Bacteroidales bacterium]